MPIFFCTGQDLAAQGYTFREIEGITGVSKSLAHDDAARNRTDELAGKTKHGGAHERFDSRHPYSVLAFLLCQGAVSRRLLTAHRLVQSMLCDLSAMNL